jgi:drug/metabolite transporter (DMT)-like permease
VLVLGLMIYKRRITRLQAIAMGVSYGGVLVVFGHEAGLQGPDAAKGALLVFLSALSYAVYLLYSGEMVKRLGSLRLVGLATSVACGFVLLQFALMRPWDTAFDVAPEVIQLSVLNAVACTFAPVLMVMMGVERLGAGLAAQTGMVGPMSTILMGVVILGEPFNGWIVVGTVLVMGGVFLVTRYGRATAK